jgi:hypothetical protein
VLLQDNCGNNCKTYLSKWNWNCWLCLPVFLELEDKFFQLELLVMSSCVIPRQISPIGIVSCVIPRQIYPIGIVSCVFLCNTKTNLSNWNWNC